MSMKKEPVAFTGETPPSVEVQEFYRVQGFNQAVSVFEEMIRTELSWKTQDDRFVGALEWMLRRLAGKDV